MIDGTFKAFYDWDMNKSVVSRPLRVLRDRTLAVLCAVCLSLACVIPAEAAVPAPREKVDVSPEMAQALDEAIKAALAGSTPSQNCLDTIAAFCLFNGMGTGSRILPERAEGAGVFYHKPLPFSLSDLMAYALNPAVPGEALYPNSVRRNVWRKQSPVLTGGAELAKSALPPEKTLFTFGREYEEVTPDTNSGSYYSYDLQRLFALSALPAGDGPGQGKKGTVLFMFSAQPERSDIGMKGAVLGPDADWNYVYTGVQGSTLPMVGWAETHIYSAATINVWVEESGKLTLYALKWIKAGWSGMNVVKTEHINAGIDRYVDGLVQVFGSERRPKPEAIVARYKELKAMSDDDLLAALKPYGEQIAQLAKAQSVDGGDFDKVLKDGAYAASMKREDRIAELLKLYMKQQLGIKMPGSASSSAAQ